MLRSFLRTALLLVPACALAAAVPPELQQAFDTFRAEGAKGWAFTQTTSSGDKQLVERYEPVKPEFSRWTLLQKNGHAPTETETKDYNAILTRRSRGENAPNVVKQLDLASCTIVNDDATRGLYRFNLSPGGDDDKSAAHMHATFSFHKPTRTIERFEIASTEAFSPMFSVKIAEARTTVDYTLPTPDRPSLLEKITVRVRGRAMLFKSLDEDMIVTYADFSPPPIRAKK